MKDIMFQIKIGNFVELKGIIGLLFRLTEKAKLLEFKEKYFQIIKEEEIINSFAWFIACIVEKFCKAFIKCDNFFNSDYNENLWCGFQKPIHYTIFCNNSNRGKFISSIYDFYLNHVLNSCTLDQFFENYLHFFKKISPVYDFLIRNNIKSDQSYLFSEVKSILNPSDFDKHPQGLVFIQSHFFKNHNHFLFHNKNDNGDWICTKGFFLGISYFLYCFLKKEIFINKYYKIIKNKPFPIENFSQEENGLFQPKISSLYYEEDGYTFNDHVEVYCAKDGIVPVYQLISQKFKEFINILDNLHEFFENNQLRKEKQQDEIISLNKDQIIIDLFNNLEPIDENIILAKIFDYKAIISLNTNDSIMSYGFFNLISKGINFSIPNDSKIKLIVIQSIPKEFEKNILMDKDIILLKSNHDYHFSNFNEIDYGFLKKIWPNNDIEEKKPNIYLGFFFFNLGEGDLSEHSFYIGDFMFGGNDRGTTRAETDNYIKIIEFCKENSNRINLTTYLFRYSFLDSVRFKTQNSLIHFFEPKNMINQFFSNNNDILDIILFQKYRKSYNSLINIYSKTDASNKEKGKSLENLASNLFALVPDFEIIDLNCETEAEEIDLIIQNKSYLPDIIDFLGFIFIIECRNLVNKVSSKQIRDFGEKIRVKGIKTGILICKAGVTGRNRNDAAKRTIRDYGVQGIRILVLDLDDLNSINNGFSPLWILRRSYCRLFFNGLKYNT